jgi:hypothetical protein
LNTFKGKIPDEHLETLLRFSESAKSLNALSVPPPVGATVTVGSALIYGFATCEINSLGKKFSGSFWGLGLAGFAAGGFLYTAYEEWDAFFSNAHGFHVQSAGAGGGIVQMNWFNDSGVPVGQFNGAAGGLGVCEVGGKGSWS